MRVAVAGTFGPLHDGHRTLLEHALRFGEDGVVVALTSDELAVETRHDSRPIPSFEERTRAVTDAIGEIDEWDRDIEIRTLETEYGIATDEPSIDALVVSPRRPPNSRRSTDCGASRVRIAVGDRRTVRLRRRRRPDLVDPDRRGEIDEHGRVLESQRGSR